MIWSDQYTTFHMQQPKRHLFTVRCCDALQVRRLHLAQALGSYFVVTCGNPAPGEESSVVIFSRACDPVLCQFAS